MFKELTSETKFQKDVVRPNSFFKQGKDQVIGPT